MSTRNLLHNRTRFEPDFKFVSMANVLQIQPRIKIRYFNLSREITRKVHG